MIKAIIFDLDGTLYPRTNSLYLSMSSSIRRWFQSQLKMDDATFNRYFEQMKAAYPNPLGAIRALGLSLRSFHSLVFDRLKPEEYLVPDEKLRLMLEGIPVNKFVVTLASRGYAIRVFNILGIELCFSGIIVPGDDEWNTSSKLVAYETARQWGNWEPREVCIVGDDMYIDLLEAHIAGYRCVLVSSSIKQTGIDCVDTVHELENVLQENRKESAHD